MTTACAGEPTRLQGVRLQDGRRQRARGCLCKPGQGGVPGTPSAEDGGGSSCVSGGAAAPTPQLPKDRYVGEPTRPQGVWMQDGRRQRARGCPCKPGQGECLAHLRLRAGVAALAWVGGTTEPTPRVIEGEPLGRAALGAAAVNGQGRVSYEESGVCCHRQGHGTFEDVTAGAGADADADAGAGADANTERRGRSKDSYWDERPTGVLL